MLTHSMSRSSARWIAMVAAIVSPIIIALPTSSARGSDDTKADALRRELRDAYRAADYKKALDAATRLHELLPDDPTAMYNMACMNSLLGEKEKAYAWLERSVDSGYDDADHLYTDSDFKQLWGEARFRDLVKKIRNRTKKESGDARTESADSRQGAKSVADKPPAGDPTPLPKVPKLSPQQHAEKQQALTRELIQVAPKGDHKKALEIAFEALAHAKAFEKAVGKRAAPLVSLSHYNIACMYSLLKEVDRSFYHLNVAMDTGGWPHPEMLQQMKGDTDLENIRKDSRYEEVIRRLKGEKPAEPKKEEKSEKPAAKPDEGKPKPSSKNLTPEERAARIEELTPALMRAAQAGDYKKALDYALQALEADDNALTNYNVACMYSLNKNIDKAFEHLFKSLDQGPIRGNPVEQLTNDTDLNNMHSDPRWKKAMEIAQKQLDEKKALPKDREVEFKYEVTLPPNHDKSKPAPLVVALHHYHGNMAAATERWKEPAAAVGAILLTPQGTLEAGEGSGQFQWGDDLNRIENNVMGAIIEVMEKHNINDQRVALVGFSQGASIAYSLAMRNPDAFSGIVPIAAYFKTESESVFSDDDIKAMHVYIMVGDEDNSQLIQSNHRALDLFSGAGAATNLVTFKGIGHGFPANAVEEQIKALRFVLRD